MQFIRRFTHGAVERTPEFEREAVQQLRLRVVDVLEGPEDYFLLRWLRARNFDLKAAENMLRNFLIWYAANIANPSLPAMIFPPEFSKLLQFKITGKDPEGRIVIWFPLGRWQLRRLLEAGHHDELIHYQYKILKYLEEVVEENRRNTGVYHLVLLGDSGELTFWQLAHYDTIQMIRRFFREYEAYFPEYLHAAYFVNNPRIFTYLFNIVKPLLSSQTISKAVMWDHREAIWKPELRKYVGMEALPVEYGGDGAAVLEETEDPNGNTKPAASAPAPAPEELKLKPTEEEE